MLRAPVRCLHTELSNGRSSHHLTESNSIRRVRSVSSTRGTFKVSGLSVWSIPLLRYGSELDVREWATILSPLVEPLVQRAAVFLSPDHRDLGKGYLLTAS